MEYSLKMVLVPQDVYDAMQFGKTRNGNIKEDKMHTSLDDPKLPLDHKMTLYNHELQKVMDEKDSVKQEKAAEHEIDAVTHHKDIIETELIESLPRSLKVKGKLLLQRLKVNNITWNSAGELIIGNTKYDGTNIIDLVNDVMHNRKYSAPFGWQIFADQLKQINVPQEMIINKTHWNYILKHKGSSLNVNDFRTDKLNLVLGQHINFVFQNKDEALMCFV